MAESRSEGEAGSASIDGTIDANTLRVAAMLDAARAGCDHSFDQLAEQCRAYLLHMANRELGEDLRAKVGASDLVQETLLEARQKIDRFRGHSEKELTAWMRQILLHKLARTGRYWRATAKRDIAREVALDEYDAHEAVAANLPDNRPSPSKQLIASERVTVLRRAIERLVPAHRQVILLRVVENRSFEEISVLMQRSEPAACKLWLRAINALRKELAAANDSR